MTQRKDTPQTSRFQSFVSSRLFRQDIGTTLTAIIEDRPESLADLSPSFPAPARWIVERCLEKDPSDRYASTTDLARELHNIRERLPEVAGSAPQEGPGPAEGDDH